MPLIPPPGWSSSTDAQCPGTGTQPTTETGTYRCQSTVKLAAGLDPGRASPAGISTPSVKLGVACASVETQTVPLTVERGQPVVNFLDSADCSPINDCIPNCYPLGDGIDFVRSPWVPVIIEGVRVPMLLDTGAEVTIVSSDFLNRLCPGQEFPDRGRTVRLLGGNQVRGPVTLTVEICCRILSHPVYFCDGASTPLLGFDAITAASLVIDTEARQIWSKDTVLYENTVSFAPSRSDTSSTAEPSTFVNSSDISLTTTDPSPSTIAPSLSVDNLSTAAAAVTTTDLSSSVISSSVATATSSVVPSETVRLPTRESSEPCDYCSTTLSSTTTDLDGSACTTATVSGVRLYPA